MQVTDWTASFYGQYVLPTGTLRQDLGDGTRTHAIASASTAADPNTEANPAEPNREKQPIQMALPGGEAFTADEYYLVVRSLVLQPKGVLVGSSLT